MFQSNVGSLSRVLSWRSALAAPSLLLAATLAVGCIGAPESSDVSTPSDPALEAESTACTAGKTRCECDTCGPDPVYTCFPSTKAGQQSCFNWCVACIP